MNPIDRDEQRGKQMEQQTTVLSSLNEIKDFVISDECVTAESLKVKMGKPVEVLEQIMESNPGLLKEAFNRFEGVNNKAVEKIEDLQFICEAVLRLTIGAGERVRSCADEDKPLPDDLKHLLSFFGEERINRHCPNWSHKTP